MGKTTATSKLSRTTQTILNQAAFALGICSAVFIAQLQSQTYPRAAIPAPVRPKAQLAQVQKAPEPEHKSTVVNADSERIRQLENALRDFAEAVTQKSNSLDTTSLKIANAEQLTAA